MAYNKEELIEYCLNAITENELTTIEDIIGFVPFSKPLYYKYKLYEVDSIKDAINKNKINTKNYLKKKWKDSDSATLQIALYKLIGTEEEYVRLANARTEVKQDHGDEPITIEIIRNEAKDH